jgi:hypothetical protein
VYRPAGQPDEHDPPRVEVIEQHLAGRVLDHHLHTSAM